MFSFFLASSSVSFKPSTVAPPGKYQQLNPVLMSMVIILKYQVILALVM